MDILKNLDMSQLYYNSRETYIIISHKDGSQNRIKLFENFLEIYKVLNDYPIISFIWTNPNKATISNSSDALKHAKDMHYNENVKNETVDYNQKKSWGQAFSDQMDRNAKARNNQDYYDKLKELQDIKDDKNPDWFTTGEKLGAGAIGAGLIGGGLLAAKARSRGKR